jgi:membrane protease YdiL (CAAX protease family)
MTLEGEVPDPQTDSSSGIDNHVIYTPPPAPPEPAETRLLKSILFGSQGVRVGWSVLLFLLLTFFIAAILGVAAALIRPALLNVKSGELAPSAAFIQEVLQFSGLLGAAAICALIERRRILDYNLRGAHRLRRFLGGIAAGFVALSALAGALYAGGWLQIGAASLSGAAIFKYGVFWGVVFLLTGLSEEGMTRCYMLFTLARGTNYWWALGSTSCFSLFAFLNSSGSGAGGVYLMTALGLVPCLLLHLKKAQSSGFWQAAWLTSTFFGYIHTFNKGETWIGIFSAAAIGFVFCVSVWLTGSAWWAIGFHASWDWAQTFFYGTADSGLRPEGHFLATNPAGATLWSGGSTGPEGSVLILPTLLLIVAALLLIYRRPRPLTNSDPVQQQLAV